MKKVFIIHGFGGVPNGGWFPWLMSELQKNNVCATSLLMPDTDTPVVEKWVAEIAHAVGNDYENTYFVAHSLGVAALLHYLESLSEDKKIGGALLVAGVIDPLETENPESRFRLIDSFLRPEIHFSEVKQKAGVFKVLHGTADVTVPFSQAEKLSTELGCELRPVNDGTHFSQRTPPIYYQLPEALTAILDILN